MEKGRRVKEWRGVHRPSDSQLIVEENGLTEEAQLGMVCITITEDISL